MTFSSFLAGHPFSCVPGQGLMVSADGRLPLHPAKPRRTADRSPPPFGGPAQGDRPQARKTQTQFDRTARTFPYPREIATEADPMVLVREKEESR